MVIMKKKVIEMVKKGIPDREIMKELGIQTKASLRRMYYEVLIEAGEIKDITTEMEAKKAARKKRGLTIGRRRDRPTW